jgi:hypothetical protein
MGRTPEAKFIRITPKFPNQWLKLLEQGNGTHHDREFSVLLVSLSGVRLSRTDPIVYI